jgi:hypothetical protein
MSIVYINLLAEQGRQLGQLSLDALRDRVCPLSAASLVELFTWFRDSTFRSKLLQIADPTVLYYALRLMNPHLAAESLYIAKTNQRSLVISMMSALEKETTLKRLASWQELEMWNWPGRIANLLVMTGELPTHYPGAMASCIGCKKSYRIWESVMAADCSAHSFCDDCDLPDSGCLVCS